MIRLSILLLFLSSLAFGQTKIPANRVLAGPASGPPAAATYRLLVPADVPITPLTNGSGTTFNIDKVDIGGTLTSNATLVEDTGQYGFAVILGSAGVTSISNFIQNPTGIEFDVATPSNVVSSFKLNTFDGFDFESSTLALRFPRLTTTERDAIVSPGAGMVVYNTSTSALNLYTTSWNEISIPAWTLASGGTLTGANTITSNTANWLNFTGTFTTTANNQFAYDWTGTHTLQATVSNAFSSFQIDPTINAGANNQVLRALYINPTFTVGAFTGVTSYSIVAVGDQLITGNIKRPTGNFVVTAGASAGTATFGTESANNVFFVTSNTTRLSIFSATGDVAVGTSDLARFYVSQPALSSGWVPVSRFDAGAHTAMSAATPFISNDFRGATWTWTAGGSWTGIPQIFNHFKAFTMSAASATTVPDAYGVFIEAPLQAGSLTITNKWALGTTGSIQTSSNITSTSVGGTATFQNFFPVSNSASGEFRIASGSTSQGLLFNHFSGGTTTNSLAASYDFVTLRSGVTNSSAGGFTYREIAITPIFNLTGSANHTVIGIDYNPTLTSLTGSTHIAARLKGDVQVLDNAGAITLLNVVDGGARVVWQANGLQIRTNSANVGGISFNGSATISNNFIVTAGFSLNNANGNYSSGNAFTITTGTGSGNNSSGTTNGLSFSSGFIGTSTAAWNQLSITGTVNAAATGQVSIINLGNTYTAAGGDVVGVYYNPTVTSITGSHYAWRHTAGFQAWASVLTPAQITANQNDYNPNGWNNSSAAPYGATTMRLSSDASRNITSLTGGVSGRVAILMNVGAQNIVLKDDDGATGTAANRFQFNADITLLPEQAIMIIYDGTSSRWRSK